MTQIGNNVGHPHCTLAIGWPKRIPVIPSATLAISNFRPFDSAGATPRHPTGVHGPYPPAKCKLKKTSIQLKRRTSCLINSTNCSESAETNWKKPGRRNAGPRRAVALGQKRR